MRPQFCFVVKLEHAVDFVSNRAFCFHDLSFFQKKIAIIKMMQLWLNWYIEEGEMNEQRKACIFSLCFSIVIILLIYWCITFTKVYMYQF